MAQDVYTYLKADGDSLTYSNAIDGEYKPVEPNTLTAEGKSGDKVIWQCEGGIRSITAITRDPNPDNPNIFDVRGIAPTNPTCWEGKIRSGLGGRKVEKYSITWISLDGRTYTIDPGVGGDDDD